MQQSEYHVGQRVMSRYLRKTYGLRKIPRGEIISSRVKFRNSPKLRKIFHLVHFDEPVIKLVIFDGTQQISVEEGNLEKEEPQKNKK